ncbi:MAG TPA: CcmD family protein [Candidatus Acidoferrum sp.]|jgi:CcmD family protein|nr:CcmD family protein [Candidatus Acidoferrum sp.]
MKNLDSVFAAYMAAWAIFFVYYVTIARRAAALRQDIERLKNSVTRGK